jgi:hypothetical protein
MTTENEPKATTEVLAKCCEVFKGTTMRPWRFIENEQNTRLVRIRGKSMKSLTKRDGLWYLLLAGPVHPYPVPDPDPFDHHHVMGLRWSQIRGEETINGYPSFQDQQLIEQAVNMHEALLGAARAVDAYANELSNRGDEETAERLDAILAPVLAAIEARKPHQQHTVPSGAPTVRDVERFERTRR